MKTIEVDAGLCLPILDELKTCITAPTQLAKKNESVRLVAGIDSYQVLVRLVLKLPLWFVKSHLWLREGYHDQEAFETAWMKQYGKPNPDQEVFVHVIGY